jgi:hypothetical protein
MSAVSGDSVAVARAVARPPDRPTKRRLRGALIDDFVASSSLNSRRRLRRPRAAFRRHPPSGAWMWSRGVINCTLFALDNLLLLLPLRQPAYVASVLTLLLASRTRAYAVRSFRGKFCPRRGVSAPPLWQLVFRRR